MSLSRRALLIAASFPLLVSCGRQEWTLSPEQRDKVVATFRAAQPFPFKIITAPGRPEATIFGYDLFNVLANRAKWPVSILPFDAENSPSVEGINVAVGPDAVPIAFPIPAKPSLYEHSADTLIRLLRASGLEVRSIIKDRRLDRDGVALVIGKRP